MEGERFAILDILALIEYDVFKTVGAEYVNICLLYTSDAADEL